MNCEKKGNNTDETEALNFLTAYDREASSMCTNVMNTQWDFNTNITEATKQRMVSPTWNSRWSITAACVCV